MSKGKEIVHDYFSNLGWSPESDDPDQYQDVPVRADWLGAKIDAAVKQARQETIDAAGGTRAEALNEAILRLGAIAREYNKISRPDFATVVEQCQFAIANLRGSPAPQEPVGALLGSAPESSKDNASGSLRVRPPVAREATED
jgi:hypothetical protein